MLVIGTIHRPGRQIIEMWVLFASLFRLHTATESPLRVNYKGVVTDKTKSTVASSHLG